MENRHPGTSSRREGVMGEGEGGEGGGCLCYLMTIHSRPQMKGEKIAYPHYEVYKKLAHTFG